MAFRTLRCGQAPSGIDSTTLTSLTMFTNPPYSPSSPSLQNADNFQEKVPKQCVLVCAVRDVSVACEVRAVRDVRNAQDIPAIQEGLYPHSRLKRISRGSESSKRNEHSELSTRNKTRDSARVHSPSAATMKTAQRAIEISKLFAVRTRRGNRDITMLYGAVRTNAVITAKSNRVPSQGLWRQPRRQQKTVLSARLERIDNG